MIAMGLDNLTGTNVPALTENTGVQSIVGSKVR